jgi:hypothetical protein
MHLATFDAFSVAYDALKARRRCKLSNLFWDSFSLRGLLAHKACPLYMTEGTLFLLIPYHDVYYDCLYLAIDEKALEAGLVELLSLYHGPLGIRASIIAKEPAAGDVAEIFRRQDFVLTKKLLRMRLAGSSKKILNAMRLFADEYRNCMFLGEPGAAYEYRDRVSFADLDDAEEILEILKENFDLVADNLPELAAVRENIIRQQIAVLRRDGIIASLHYFYLHHNTLHLLYDVTRKEYRREGFFMLLAAFMHEHFTKQGRKDMRVLGWRDAGRRKLLSHARKSNEHPDGIVIYNMLWTPSGTGDAEKENQP